jgi:hypothetical protein
MQTIRQIKRAFWLQISVPLLLFGSGCAQLNPTHTGYLSDYSQLQQKAPKIPIIRSHVIEAGGSGALDGIDSFVIEPVGWLAKDESPTLVLENSKRNLSDKLRKSLVDELEKLLPVVDCPGPHTATVRAAVTQVAYARPILNSALSAVAVPIFNGGGVVEAEVIGPDGKTQIAVVVAALPGRARDVLGFFTWQGHAEIAMRRSALELRTILSQTPQVPPPEDISTLPVPDTNGK